MCKKKVGFIVCILWVMVLVGCGQIDKKIIQDDSKKDSSKSEYKEPKKVDPISEKLKLMNIDEKIGQLVLVGLEGTSISEKDEEMIRKYHVGGVIFYQKNIKDPDQLLNLMNTLNQMNIENKVPLFLSVDEEGGRVSRLSKFMKNIPTSKTIGKLNDSKFAFEMGKILGKKCSVFGFNMDFAPVLDINSNPKNSVISDRSFGSNEEVVSTMGMQVMKGLASEEVIPVIKHFPGHGDTFVDSHIGLPTLDHDLERLENFEWVPFKKAIKNGADVVMIAHILLPKIDSDFPASLSKIMIDQQLRENLGFLGVIITDDMTMGAIDKNYNIEKAVVRSILAGTDIVLIGHDKEKQIKAIKAIKAIKKAVEEGVISKGQLNEHVYRILKLKNKYNLSNRMIHDVEVDRVNEEIQRILSTKFKKH